MSELLRVEEYELYAKARRAIGKQNYMKVSPKELYDLTTALDQERVQAQKLEAENKTLQDRIAAITHEWEVTTASRAHARAEWERLLRENEALKDALQEILKFAASRVLQSGSVILSPLDWDALESIYQEAATALAHHAPKEGEA